jgi:hypothetical protein
VDRRELVGDLGRREGARMDTDPEPEGAEVC